MNINTRLKFYKEVEKLRGIPLVVYMTSPRRNMSGLMSSDVLPELVDQIDLLPDDLEEIDFYIETTGGDALVAWRAISLLRSKAKKINVLVSDIALSAGTIFVLGADEIVMTKYGCLGPIDPQIIMRKEDGTISTFSYEDILSFVKFAQDDIGLSDQERTESVLRMINKTVNPAVLGMSKRASSLSIEIGEKLLLTHMKSANAKAKARQISTDLNKKFFSHGHTVYREEAKKIGLNIKYAENSLENAMRKIHDSFMEELDARREFDFLSEFLSEESNSVFFEVPAAINIPPNVNPQIVQQLIVNHINEQLQNTTSGVEREFKIAFLESQRLASEFKVKFRILATRLPDLKFKLNPVKLDACWSNVKIEKKGKKKK